MAKPPSRATITEPAREIRFGYQKTAIPLVVKARKLLEQRFEAQGATVKWVEFAFGPPLLEAVNAGAVDYGYTGDSPPVFAQAAHELRFEIDEETGKAHTAVTPEMLLAPRRRADNLPDLWNHEQGAK